MTEIGQGWYKGSWSWGGGAGVRCPRKGVLEGASMSLRTDKARPTPSRIVGGRARENNFQGPRNLGGKV